MLEKIKLILSLDSIQNETLQIYLNIILFYIYNTLI